MLASAMLSVVLAQYTVLFRHPGNDTMYGDPTVPMMMEAGHLALEDAMADPMLSATAAMIDLVEYYPTCWEGSPNITFIQELYDDPNHNLVAIVGGWCSYMDGDVAAWASSNQVVQMAYGPTSSFLSNRIRFPYYMRTHQINGHDDIARAQLFNHFGWGVGAILSGSRHRFVDGEPYGSSMNTHGKMMIESMSSRSTVVWTGLYNADSSQDNSDENSGLFAEIMATGAKIILLNAYSGVETDMLMTIAASMNMTGSDGYLYVARVWTMQGISSQTAMYLYGALWFDYGAEDWAAVRMANPERWGSTPKSHPSAVFTYDAMTAIIRGLHAVGGGGQALLTQMSELDFMGQSGRVTYYNGERATLPVFLNNLVDNGAIVEVGAGIVNYGTIHTVSLNITHDAIMWPTGGDTPWTTTCGDIKSAYRASNCCGNPNQVFSYSSIRRL